MSRGSFSRRHRNRQEARMTTDTDEALVRAMELARVSGDKPAWLDPDGAMARVLSVVRQHDAPRIAALEAEVARLTGLLRQCFGMADQGIDAPNAAYRWCERIDEVISSGRAMPEYDRWARDLPPALTEKEPPA